MNPFTTTMVHASENGQLPTAQHSSHLTQHIQPAATMSSNASEINTAGMMTHFPLSSILDQENESRAAVPALIVPTGSSNSVGGIFNSFMGNLFRSNSSMSQTNTMPRKTVATENEISAQDSPSHTNQNAGDQQQPTTSTAPDDVTYIPHHHRTASTQSAHSARSTEGSASNSPSPRLSRAQINPQKKMSLISSIIKGFNDSEGETINGIKKAQIGKNGLIDYKQSEFRRYWMPDSTGKECYECYEKFTAFRRRHHCRLCGQIFCGKCSNRQVNGAELGYSGVLRLCTFCADQVEVHIVDRMNSKYIDPSPPIDCLENNEHPACQDSLTPENGEYDRHSISSTIQEHFLSRARGELSIDPPDPMTFPPGKASFSDSISSSPETQNLDRMFDEKIQQMLDCVLVREHLDSETWKPLLLGLSKRVVSMVAPTILKIQDALNILDFIHVKKLAVGKQPSYEVVKGVAFTKSLVHTSMSSNIKNVSLMLLTGTISYERVVEKLSSLETIMLQEQEYLKIQVNRVTSRRISLLLVENSVSKAASDMLLDVGIALVTDVKRKVLDRVAIATNSDVITSLDAQFLQPRIGFVPDFTQREFTLVGGVRKKVLILDNCTGNFGASILLFGQTQKDLEAAKRVLKFLIVARYSSKLEIAFLALFNSLPYSLSVKTKKVSITVNESEKPKFAEEQLTERFKCGICELNRENEALTDSNPTEFAQFLRQMQLTNSPALHFAPPYLETQAGRSCYLLPYFKQSLFPVLQPDQVQEQKEGEERWQRALRRIETSHTKIQQENQKQIRHPILKENLVEPAKLLNEADWAKFRCGSSLLFRQRHELNKDLEKRRAKEVSALIQNQKKAEISSGQLQPNSTADVLSPYNRQRIAFLYCANGKKVTNAKTFCMGPYVLPRHFFLGKDTSLGTFLSSYCFNPDYKCKGCDRTMMSDHLRRIVHRNTRIEISTEELPSTIPNIKCPSIICWRRCPKCASNSCIVPMPDSVYHLSFAKFIDYLANGTHWTSSLPCSMPVDTQITECKHCTFHTHHHYFAFQHYITAFKVNQIRPLHTIFASMCCRINPAKVMCKDLIEMNYELNSMASEVFDKALSYFKPDQPERNMSDNDEENDDQAPLPQPPQVQLSPAAEALLSFVEQFKLTFRSHMGKFDPDGIFKRSESVDSNDFYYIQAANCLMRCRYFLYTFISKWNSTRLDPTFTGAETSKNATFLSSHSKKDNSASNLLLHAIVSNSSLAALTGHSHVPETQSAACLTSGEGASESLVGGMKGGSNKSSAVVMELPFIVNPLPKDLHFELPMNNATILLRDLFDSKGNPTPDIGSIIAYALASGDYDEKKHHKVKDGEEDICNVTFGDSRTQCSIKVYFAEKFEGLRSVIFGDGEEQFIRSLSRSSPWHPQGGKSGASFFRTDDERFVIKQMLKSELEAFKESGLKYMEYVNAAAADGKLTALCKIYGVYGINFANKQTGYTVKIDVLIMEYLFYRKNIKQLWDLKGSLRNRYASTKTEDAVLLDENLVQDLWGNQLYVHPHSKSALNQAIVNDSQFLCNQGIMDYSLLAGISHENDEVIIGIVDYMRTYTLDKKVESLVKNAFPVAHSSTVISPEQYRRRFYEAIDGYFAIAPDQWTGQSDPTLG
ncbi:phosphatidylinositol-4-phosphate 5-Kinase domain-containing protein [Ditylenchus destructor]|uniref:1-phosphatidylinositol-3-phosphate 5-kinase n=1 Tax=Ditylenchus destructor TaxID=166010 RepID=A0AAD4MM22_9BILA|nr:phosphatidylinositol-4-phosphate 5-Kinase domain-containing protein [Ditylenchus destructor]